MCFATCQERGNAIWSDIINSTEWVRSRRLLFCLCDLSYSQPMDMNHTATCCQLCVVTCASAANRRLFFFFLAPVATPKESVFQAKREHQLHASRLPADSYQRIKHLHCLMCSSKVPLFFLFFSKFFVPVLIEPGKKPGLLRQVALLISQCCYPPNMHE